MYVCSFTALAFILEADSIIFKPCSNEKLRDALEEQKNLKIESISLAINHNSLRFDELETIKLVELFSKEDLIPQKAVSKVLPELTSAILFALVELNCDIASLRCALL